jgi:hypothetical protein
MEAREESHARERSRAGSVWTLARVFLRIGATAFGGLGAALTLVERELVAKRQESREMLGVMPPPASPEPQYPCLDTNA